MDDSVDVIMITYNRPAHVRTTLPRLLASADERTRVWLWHNGDHAETLEAVEQYATHPRVHRFHHSRENRMLREPTNWLFRESDGAFLSKVDDDCIVPENWIEKLRAAHADEPKLGVVGCWRFLESDFVPELALRKIRTVGGGHRILTHPWVEGSGYLMRRACYEQAGPIRDHESFTHYCLRIALAGWQNGWYYPFLWQEHLDDPGAPHSPIKTQADFEAFLPLSARTFQTQTLEQWNARLRHSARAIQAGSSDPRSYVGWRSWLTRAKQRARRSLQWW